MIFSSHTFFAFFLIVFVMQWYVIPAFAPDRLRLRITHVFLLIASYYFYMFSVWEYGALIAFSTLVDYVAGRMIGASLLARPDDARAKRLRLLLLLLSLGMNLGLLGYFKYTDFFIGSVVDFINQIAPGTYNGDERESLFLQLVLPVGISFFTFQSMSYTIDVYRGALKAERDVIRFALFICFFPQLVAGPIVTAKEFLPQLQKLPEFNLERLRIAARWFGLGYFKKVVLADNMAPIIDPIYANPAAYDAAGHWLGAIAFWVQVYCDFSGYSDMAWGAAIFLGYNLPENFRMPYLSKSVTEHWQRWHISLIRWNRDYLYFPLGGNRAGFLRHKFNVFFTMWVAGVWHGANWTFVIWGAIHGLLLAGESSWRELLKRREERKQTERAAQEAARMKGDTATHTAGYAENAAPRYWTKRWYVDLLRLLRTSFITIYFGTMFRANDIGDAWLILVRMLGFDQPDLAAPITGGLYRPVLLGALAVIAGHVLGWFIFERRTLQPRIPAWVELAFAPVFILLCIQLGQSDVQPFIYFVF